MTRGDQIDPRSIEKRVDDRQVALARDAKGAIHIMADQNLDQKFGCFRHCLSGSFGGRPQSLDYSAWNKMAGSF